MAIELLNLYLNKPKTDHPKTNQPKNPYLCGRFYTMKEEGYIKYHSDWERDFIDLKKNEFEEMNYWRAKLIAKNWIGVYDDGIGFGNISRRGQGHEFYISGSATGGIPMLATDDYALVNEYEILKNYLKCTGQTAASSESLSHAALYENSKSTKVIIHIHDLKLWEKYKNVLPTTARQTSYGTPEMAYELQRIQSQIKKESKVIVMGGHKEGIIAYGDTFEYVFKMLTML